MWPARLVSCNASQSAIAREMIAAKGGKPTTFFHDSSDRSPTTFSAILTPYFPRIVQFQARSVYVLKQFIQMFCTIYPDDLTVVPCRFVTRNDVGPEAIHQALVFHAVIHAQFANVHIVHGHYANI